MNWSAVTGLNDFQMTAFTKTAGLDIARVVYRGRENNGEVLKEIRVREHREFGGVDLLRHPGGRWYLLEVNMPCYYPHAQEVAGVDIAGAMVDHLHAKALRLAAS